MQDLNTLGQINNSAPEIGHEALAGLQRLFAEAANSCSEILTAKFDHPIEVTLDQQTQRSLRQFTYSLSPPINLMHFKNRKDHQSWWIQFDTSCVSAMLDLMFGAKSVDWKPLDRPATPVEAELLQAVVDEITTILTDTWRPVCSVELSLNQWLHELNEIESDFHDILDTDIIQCRWEISIDQRQAVINLALPRTFVKAWEKRLMQYHYDELELLEADQVRGTVMLTLDNVDLETIQVGEMISTGHASNTPLDMVFDNHETIAVHLGCVNDHKAVEIASDSQPVPEVGPTK
jgi:flagellar motor switch protein FliM